MAKRCGNDTSARLCKHKLYTRDAQVFNMTRTDALGESVTWTPQEFFFVWLALTYGKPTRNHLLVGAAPRLEELQDPEKRPKLTLHPEAEPVDSIDHYKNLLETWGAPVDVGRRLVLPCFCGAGGLQLCYNLWCVVLGGRGIPLLVYSCFYSGWARNPAGSMLALRLIHQKPQ